MDLYRRDQSAWRSPPRIAKEDENLTIAKSLKRHHRRNKIYHAVNSRLKLTNLLVTPPTVPAIHKKRDFRWSIWSCHVPKEFQAKKVRDYTPWYLVIRYLLVDLPEQLENVISMRPWRNHLVEDPKGPRYLNRLPCIQGCYNQ